jgi:hypothetical protein
MMMMMMMMTTTTMEGKDCRGHSACEISLLITS